MNLNATPSGNRLHIGIFGRRNSGKSSLINALTGQQVALVSDVAGTTTDPVNKAMEIAGIGPCIFIDTAGFDDEGILGKMRVDKTKKIIEKTDIAMVIFTCSEISMEILWIKALRESSTPVIPILNKSDLLSSKEIESMSIQIEHACDLSPIVVSAKLGEGIGKIREEMVRRLPEDYEAEEITLGLAAEGDTVMLVMPQDIAAPKGRLILPQVQTLRELLDKKCTAICTCADKMENALAALSKPPDLIITDSQVFPTVYELKSAESKLTSFSILFANYKGDLEYFIDSAKAVDSLTSESKVLIAEACTHAPLEEDIGRIKIPAMLRSKIGQALTVDMVSGADFPHDLSGYGLVIHCGACMFNRKHVLSRVRQAKAQGIPMTNYGVILARLSGILDYIDY